MAAASNNNFNGIILVVCALAEEALGFHKVLKRKGITSEEKDNTFLCNFEGYKIIIVWEKPGCRACKGLIDKWISKIGKQRIKLLIMTGICAGLKKETKLGDIVVPDKVYDYATGMKITEDELPQLDVSDTISLNSEIFKWVDMRAKDKEDPLWLEFIPLFKPPERDHIKEYTLDLLSQRKTQDQIIETIKQQFSEKYHETIENVAMHEIQDLIDQDFIQETENSSYSLTEQGKNKIKELKRNARLLERKFPYNNSKCPSLIVGPLACGPEVRKDKFIEKLVQISGQRKTVALDMESYAIMQTGRDENILACVVKSVSDYGDNDKNDEFHSYAAQTSAAFALCMIRDYLSKIGKSDADVGALPDQQCAFH